MRIDFKVLTPSQSQEFVGGGNPIKIGGGFLEVTEIDGVKGTIYKGNDGSTYFLKVLTLEVEMGRQLEELHVR